MEPVVVSIETEEGFGPQTPVGVPVGELLAMTRSAGDTRVTPQGSHMGIWECSPGKFKRMVPQAEYSYFLCGEGSFTPDGGAPVHFRAGDMIYFQANTQGVWDIKQTIRKAYLIIQ